MTNLAPEEVYLTPEEVASRLKGKASTLANWRHQSIGPPYLKLGRILYPEAALERWLASCLRVPEQPDGTEP